MLAKKCDRCNALYEHYFGDVIFDNDGKAKALILIDADLNRMHYNRKSYDLCPKCIEELNAFLKAYDAEAHDE